MAQPTPREVLNMTTQLIKLAQAKSASAADAFGDMPGAGKETPENPAFKKSDPEVVSGDPSTPPGAGRTTEGAGDDNPAVGKKTLESGEPADASVTEKPLLGTDAKTASALADELRGHIKAAKAAPAPAAPVAKAAPVTPAPSGAPASTKVAATDEGFDMDLTGEVLAKIAAITLADERGANIARQILNERAGEEACQSAFDFITKQAAAADDYVKGAEYAEKCAAAVLQRAQPFNARERMLEKIAQVMGPDMAGMADGAGMPEGDAAVSPEEVGMPEDVSPEEIAAAVEEAVKAGVVDEETAAQIMGELQSAGGEAGALGDDEGATLEQLAQEIDQAVASGDMTPEEAEAVISAIIEESAGGAPAGGAEPPAEAPPAEEPPAPAKEDKPADDKPADDEKKAAAKQAAVTGLKAAIATYVKQAR